MIAGEDFISILQICAFLAVVWTSGRICGAVNVSPMVGEIVAGLVLGPQVGAVVPLFNENENLSIWEVMGQIGVLFLLFEAGLEINFKTIRAVGLKAFLIAVTGMILPIGISLLFLAPILGHPLYPDAVSAGAALAPTSVAVAVNLLAEVKLVSSRPGQTICAAAFLDDVLSLVILVSLESLSSGSSSDYWKIAVILVCAFLFLGIGCVLGAFVTPKPFQGVVDILGSKKWFILCKDEVLFLLMIVCLVICSTIGALLGSFFLGGFISGVLFCRIDRALIVWRKLVKPVTVWGVRFFFACTIGFVIPVSSVLNATTFWQGTILGLVAAIFGKVFTGVLLANKGEKLLVGWAMCGRGEFAYLIAQSSLEGGIMSEQVFGIVIWALIWATLICPIAFRLVLRRFMRSAKATQIDNLIPAVHVMVFVPDIEREDWIQDILATCCDELDLTMREMYLTTDFDGTTMFRATFVQGNEGQCFESDKMHQIKNNLGKIFQSLKKQGKQTLAVKPAKAEDYMLVQSEDSIALQAHSSVGQTFMIPLDNEKNDQTPLINLLHDRQFVQFMAIEHHEQGRVLTVTFDPVARLNKHAWSTIALAKCQPLSRTANAISSTNIPNLDPETITQTTPPNSSQVFITADGKLIATHHQPKQHLPLTTD